MVPRPPPPPTSTAAGAHSEDPRLRLALDESWKSIDVQREQVGEIKSRAIAMLSVATIAVGLLGRERLVEQRPPSGWGVVVVAGLAILLLGTIWASIPRPWKFARRPDALRWYANEGKTIDEMRAGLLADAAEHFEAHASVLRQLRHVQSASVVALGFIAVALLFTVTTN